MQLNWTKSDQEALAAFLTQTNMRPILILREQRPITRGLKLSDSESRLLGQLEGWNMALDALASLADPPEEAKPSGTGSMGREIPDMEKD